MKLKVFALTLVILIAMALPGTASAAGDQPYTLAAPTNLTAELKYDFEGVPYFELKLNTPQSVVAVNNNILDDGYPVSSATKSAFNSIINTAIMTGTKATPYIGTQAHI